MTEIEPKKHQNVQEAPFWQKAPGFNGLKEKVFPSMALSENVNHLVHTVDNDLTFIGALDTDDSEAIESMLPRGVTNVSPQPPEPAEGTFR